MKRFSLYILLILMTNLALAQPNRPALRRAQLQKEMAIAHYLLQEHPDAEAEQWLAKAEQLQKESVELFRQRKRVLARRKGLEAHELVTRIIKKLGRQHFIDLGKEVKSLIDRAEVIIPSSDNSEAKRLLKQARVKWQTARREVQNGDYREALELLRTAKFQVQRSLLLVQQNQGDLDTKIDIERTRFENLMQRADVMLPDCDDAQAQKLYNQVKEQQRLLEDAMKSGDKSTALDLYYSSTRLLLRAIDLCRDSGSATQQESGRAIEQLDTELAAQENMKVQPEARRRQIHRAREFAEKAHSAYENQDYNQALILAQNGLESLQKKTPQPAQAGGDQRLRQELSRLEKDISTAKSSAADDPQKMALINAAVHCTEDAEKFLSKGEAPMALQTILCGHRLLLRMDSTSPLTVQVDEEIRKLKMDIESARKQSVDVSLLIYADRAATRAQNAYDAGQLAVAVEFVKYGRDILKLNK